MKKKKMEPGLKYLGTSKVELFTLVGRFRTKCPKCGKPMKIRLEAVEE